MSYSYNVVQLSDNQTYNGVIDTHEEFAIDFGENTNITIESENGAEDRIRFTGSYLTADNLEYRFSEDGKDLGYVNNPVVDPLTALWSDL